MTEMWKTTDTNNTPQSRQSIEIHSKQCRFTLIKRVRVRQQNDKMDTGRAVDILRIHRHLSIFYDVVLPTSMCVNDDNNNNQRRNVYMASSFIVCVFFNSSNCNLFKMECRTDLYAVCVSELHCSSFHACIILNRHIKCNYKISISVFIVGGWFFSSALWFSERSQFFTFITMKDKRFATRVYFIWLYTQFPTLNPFQNHMHAALCASSDVQSAMNAICSQHPYIWREIYLSCFSISNKNSIQTHRHRAVNENWRELMWKKAFQVETVQNNGTRCTNTLCVCVQLLHMNVTPYVVWTKKLRFLKMNRCLHTLNVVHGCTHTYAPVIKFKAVWIWLDAATATTSIICIWTNAVFLYFAFSKRIVQWWMASFALHFSCKLKYSLNTKNRFVTMQLFLLLFFHSYERLPLLLPFQLLCFIL